MKYQIMRLQINSCPINVLENMTDNFINYCVSFLQGFMPRRVNTAWVLYRSGVYFLYICFNVEHFQPEFLSCQRGPESAGGYSELFVVTRLHTVFLPIKTTGISPELSVRGWWYWCASFLAVLVRSVLFKHRQGRPTSASVDKTSVQTTTRN